MASTIKPGARVYVWSPGHNTYLAAHVVMVANGQAIVSNPNGTHKIPVGRLLLTKPAGYAT